MRPGTLAVVSMAGMLLLVSVASGPLVAAVDLTSGATGSDGGIQFGVGAGGDGTVTNDWQGDATVRVTSAPVNSVRFERERFTGKYVVRGSKLVLRVSDVSAEPILVYELVVPALQFSSFRMVVLDGSSEGRLAVSLPPGELSADQLGKEAYRGIIRIKLRGDDRRTVYERNVTVTVQR